jgi:integrase
VKRAYRLALQAGKLLPGPHVPMLRESNARQGFFEPDTFAAVRDARPENIRPVVTFAYLTGWRLHSEVLPQEWHRVDFEAGELRLDPGATKNGERRTYPFTAELRTLLEGQRRICDALKERGRIVPLVFHRNGRPIKSFGGPWEAACEAAGCPERIVHDFRRTAVRNLERAGVPRSAAMAMVGHKTESIYRRYAIVDAGVLRDAAAKIDALTVAPKGRIRRFRKSA